MTHDLNPDIVEELEAHYLSRDDIIMRWGATISSFLAIPGLVGFWPMSSTQRSTGNAYDLSGQGRTLTYNGNAVYETVGAANGLVTSFSGDGTGDYLSRADETDLDIQGNETIYFTGQTGLTMGGWFWADSLSGSPSFMGKHDNASVAGSSYLLYVVASAANFIVYNTPSLFDVIGATLSTGQWYFIVGRYRPSIAVSIFVNGVEAQDTTGIPATINNSAAPFQILARNAGNLLDGKASLCFLSAIQLSDTIINGLFQQSRVLFGV